MNKIMALPNNLLEGTRKITRAPQQYVRSDRIMRNMTDNASKKGSPFTEIVSKAIEIGADKLEIEYKDGYEEVFTLKGGRGFGIAKLESSSEEAALLREELYVIGKRKKGRIRTADAHYDVNVEIFDSFGEDAFRVTLEKI